MLDVFIEKMEQNETSIPESPAPVRNLSLTFSYLRLILRLQLSQAQDKRVNCDNR